ITISGVRCCWYTQLTNRVAAFYVHSRSNFITRCWIIWITALSIAMIGCEWMTVGKKDVLGIGRRMIDINPIACVESSVGSSAKALNGQTIDLCLPQRQRHVVCKSLEQHLSTKLPLICKDKTRDHNDDGAHNEEFDEGKS